MDCRVGRRLHQFNSYLLCFVHAGREKKCSCVLCVSLLSDANANSIPAKWHASRYAFHLRTNLFTLSRSAHLLLTPSHRTQNHIIKLTLIGRIAFFCLLVSFPLGLLIWCIILKAKNLGVMQPKIASHFASRFQVYVLKLPSRTRDQTWSHRICWDCVHMPFQELKWTFAYLWNPAATVSSRFHQYLSPIRAPCHSSVSVILRTVENWLFDSLWSLLISFKNRERPVCDASYTRYSIFDQIMPTIFAVYLRVIQSYFRKCDGYRFCVE